MISFPNIKINLGLRITSKRQDGYHDIESCFYPVKWCDALEIMESEEFSFESSGLPIPGETDSNLVVKAYKLLNKDFEIPPVRVHLLKAIPMGAGLGGGSADGTFMLKLLNDKFMLGMSDSQLENYALQLGSDCPFFVKNQPVIAKGRGEILESINLDLAGKHVLLINPGHHIGTKEAYAGIRPKQPKVSLKVILESTDISEWKHSIINEFEISAFAKFPEIKEIKEELYSMGAYYASMSGSGSTVYGIFEGQPQAELIMGHKCKVVELA